MCSIIIILNKLLNFGHVIYEIFTKFSINIYINFFDLYLLNKIYLIL